MPRRGGGWSLLGAGVTVSTYSPHPGDEAAARAKVYGCARDTDLAKLVFNVDARMVALSPVLSRRLRVVVTHGARILDEKAKSVYVVVPADALGNLGSNLSCVVFDEVLTQPN